VRNHPALGRNSPPAVTEVFPSSYLTGFIRQLCFALCPSPEFRYYPTLYPMKLTPFESEILDSILWQVEGLRLGRVTRRATTRILRATIRRIPPRLIARSRSTRAGTRERDHAIPVHVVCNRILSTANLNRCKLEKILAKWLVAVELTAREHRDALMRCGLSRCIPDDWDGVDLLVRYRKAGIQLSLISTARRS
jgi:hypothetical protein